MRVLITNVALESWTGSELYTRDVACGLRARGHEPLLFSPNLGPLAEELRREGFVVVNDLKRLPARPDLIHGQHHIETMMALDYFRDVPAVFFCHGTIPWEESPPRHPRILRYVAVSEPTADRIVLRAGVPASLVRLIPNFVDTDRFRSRDPLPDRPRRVLVFSNQASEANFVPAVRCACERLELQLDVVGARAGRPARSAEDLLGAYDIVLACGRAALEGMAVGAAVVLCDIEGLGEMVTPEKFQRLQKANFGRAALTRAITAEALEAELRRYDPAVAARVRDHVRAQVSLAVTLDRMLAVYEEARTSFAGPWTEEEERQAIHRYHCWLSRSVRSRASLEEQLRHLEERLQHVEGSLAWRLTSALGRTRSGAIAYRVVRRLLPFLWFRARPVPPRPAGPASLAEGRAPDLACVVLCLAGQPEVVDAVRSLAAQDVPVEVAVVNSGGRNPDLSLRAAGLSARMIHREESLLPGGARNLGVAHTSAPFVAFLAADCLAEPGWVSGRLARHRAGAQMVSSAVTNATRGSVAAWTSYLLLFSNRMPGTPAWRVLHYGISYARGLLAQVGPFREDLRAGEDTELNQRAAALAAPVWAPDVRTAHRHPVTLRAMLGDQFERGARAARAQGRLTGVPHARITAANALRRWRRTIWGGLRAADSWAGGRALLAALLSPLGAAAYALGALRSARIPDPDVVAVNPPQRTKARREPRIYALCAFHNEARYLPGLLENLRGEVDGLLALEDGSTDGSGDIVAGDTLTRRLIRVSQRADYVWIEPNNRQRLIEAAWETDADWLIAIDPDERLETGFRARALREIARANREGLRAFNVRMRELWNQGDTYRVDGIWGHKMVARFFRSSRDHEFDPRELHGHWGPLNGRVNGHFPESDLILYHLRMIHEEDRRRRQERYIALDPNRKWQAGGYEYLTDEFGILLERVPEERGYSPGCDEDH
jgi:GT2 family glycosyltransferase/glycosyltransferase involved in cell wall biosynthesis